MNSRTRFLGVAIAVLFLTASFLPSAAAERSTEIEIGIGYDDNPYLTPETPYFDQNGLVTMNPAPQSGIFIPAKLKGGFTGNGDGHRFILKYRLRHNAYLDSALTNADETKGKIAAGMEWVTARNHRRENSFFVTPFAGYNKEVYFDRDTGLDQVFTQGNASGRFTYKSIGLEAGYRHRTGEKVRYRVRGLFESRDYEKLAGVRPLDQSLIRLSTDWSVDLSETVRLYLDYYYQIRDYDERLSRDANGALFASSPSLKYLYNSLGASLRFRPAKVWRLFLDLDYLVRDDDFVSYNDYTETGYRLRSVWRGEGKRLRAAIRYRERDYDNAFIFDKPANPVGGLANPHKSYEILDVDVQGEMPLRNNMNLFAELDYRDQKTSDPRYDYNRLQATAGVAFTF